MYESRVAARYAKPLLQLAIERDVLAFVEHDMSLFLQVCRENRAFASLLKSPIVSQDKKHTILREIFNGKTNPLTLSFFELIVRKGRENVLEEIAKQFIHQYKEHKNIAEAEVVTSMPLSDELRETLKKLVTGVSGGKQVELKEKVDQELIGGFVLKMGDRQLDESVASKLQKLKIKFNDNSYIAKY